MLLLQGFPGVQPAQQATGHLKLGLQPASLPISVQSCLAAVLRVHSATLEAARHGKPLLGKAVIISSSRNGGRPTKKPTLDSVSPCKGNAKLFPGGKNIGAIEFSPSGLPVQPQFYSSSHAPSRGGEGLWRLGMVVWVLALHWDALPTAVGQEANRSFHFG